MKVSPADKPVSLPVTASNLLEPNSNLSTHSEYQQYLDIYAAFSDQKGFSIPVEVGANALLRFVARCNGRDHFAVSDIQKAKRVCLKELDKG